MGMNVHQDLELFAAAMPRRAPPIPYAIAGLGQVGHLHHRGVYINSAYVRHIIAMRRDEEKLEQAAREISNGKLDSNTILGILKRGSDSRNAIRMVKSARALLQSWEDVGIAQRDGRSTQTFRMCTGGNPSTVNGWHSMIRVTGGGGGDSTTGLNYVNAPGGSQITAAFGRSPPLPANYDPAAHTLYLCGFTAQVQVGGMNLVSDILVAAGNLAFNVTTTQAVNTTSLPRYTGGEGVAMCFEVQTAVTAVTTTLTAGFTNQAGTPRTAISGNVTTFSGIAGAIIYGGTPTTRLDDPADYGVRSLESATWAGAHATAGAFAALLHKPLAMLYVSPLDTANASDANYAEKQMGMPGTDFTSIVPVGSGYSPYLGIFSKNAIATGGNPTIFIMDLAWG